MNMSKVYVVSETTHNIASAQQYGEIITILPPNTQIAFSPTPTVRRIKRALENFCKDDFLLLIGDPSCIGIVCSTASSKTNGIYKVLKWDKRENIYIPINIDLEL
jgi:hypothetical protein